jgi:hypothetical protein
MGGLKKPSGIPKHQRPHKPGIKQNSLARQFNQPAIAIKPSEVHGCDREVCEWICLVS